MCEPPTEIPNGVIENPNNETLFGSTVEYECKTGYKLVGPKVLTCLANGQYDALPPTCQGKWNIYSNLLHFKKFQTVILQKKLQQQLQLRQPHQKYQELPDYQPRN